MTDEHKHEAALRLIAYRAVDGVLLVLIALWIRWLRRTAVHIPFTRPGFQGYGSPKGFTSRPRQ